MATGLTGDPLARATFSGAAVDAFAAAPPRDSPLLTAPNIVFTPHIGAFSQDANAAMGRMVAADVARVLRGEAPQHPVN